MFLICYTRSTVPSQESTLRVLGLLVIPVLRDSLGSGIETVTIDAQHMLVSQEGVLVSGEGVVGRRDRDAHIDAYHAAVGAQLELTGIVATLSEDAGAVCKGIGVHDGQTFLKVLDPLDADNRPENFPVAHGHTRLHMIEDRGAKEEAVFISRHHHIAAVQHQLCTLIDALLNPFADLLLVGGGHDRAKIRLGIIGAANDQLLGRFLQKRHKLIGDALLHTYHRQGHAPHTGAAEGGVDHGADRALQIAVLQNQSVVLCLTLSLDPLAVGGGLGVDFLAHAGGAHEGDGLDRGSVSRMSASLWLQVTRLTTPLGKPASS